MASIQTAAWDERDAVAMRSLLDRQRAAFDAEMPVGVAVRIDRLRRALALIVSAKNELAAALSEDFGHRSTEMTMITDIMASVGPLKHAIKHVDGWMKPERRALRPILWLLGARGAGRVPAQGRRRHHLAVEFPGQPDLRAARQCAGRR